MMYFDTELEADSAHNLQPILHQNPRPMDFNVSAHDAKFSHVGLKSALWGEKWTRIGCGFVPSTIGLAFKEFKSKPAGKIHVKNRVKIHIYILKSMWV